MDGGSVKTPDPLLADLDRWAAEFEAVDEVFGVLRPGARLGFLPRANADAMDGTLLVWEATQSGMQAGLRPFESYVGTGVDIIFVPEAAALRRLHDAEPGEALAAIRAAVRESSVIFFSLRRGRELRALGYEPLLDALGLAFLGACR
ncbi:MAG: hypothetical protein ACTSUD_10965 [Alphaproteobacteria bacterium]